MTEKTIGIIGCGNMGSAIAGRLTDGYPVIVFDKDRDKTSGLEGIKSAKNIAGLLKEAQVIILAVKPQDYDAVLDEVKSGISCDRLLISIAAGISTQYLEKKLGQVKIIRVMPNMGITIGAGMTCLSKGKFAADEDLDFARGLFKRMGQAMCIEERMMNAATAVSGSGPAYVCEYLLSQSLGLDNTADKGREVFLNAFRDAAVGVGFSRQDAAFLVEKTFSATVNFLKIKRLAPEQLIRQVASKGGTTEAALAILHNGGSLEEAVRAALRRAEELSKKDS